MKHRILFVCLGNICRSPAAQGIFQKIVDNHNQSEIFEIDSAGTYAGHAGELPDPRMRAAAAKRGYTLTHHARRISRNDFTQFDKIIVMDDSNFDDVYDLAPDTASCEKIVRMTDFCRKHIVHYVPDPYYEGNEGFERVLNILEDACENLYGEIIEKHSMFE